jgi:hypothetical protein
MEQIDDEFRASVASRRQGVPGRRDDRDPKRVGYAAHLPPRGGNPMIAGDRRAAIRQKVDSDEVTFAIHRKGSFF